MRKNTDSIPDDLNEEIDIRCDAGSRLIKELWSVVVRSSVDNAMTACEVIGCLETVKQSFIDTYLRGATEE